MIGKVSRKIKRAKIKRYRCNGIEIYKKDNKQVLKEIIEQNDISIISKKLIQTTQIKRELVEAISSLEKLLKLVITKTTCF